MDFNSHAHVERDLRHKPEELKKAISTHTLTWSVTMTWTRCQRFYRISTHTLTWSVTTAKIDSSEGGEFQLTRSRGA